MSCHAKKQYPSWEAATLAMLDVQARKEGHSEGRAYYCRIHHCWHLTSQVMRRRGRSRGRIKR